MLVIQYQDFLVWVTGQSGVRDWTYKLLKLTWSFICLNFSTGELNVVIWPSVVAIIMYWKYIHFDFFEPPVIEVKMNAEVIAKFLYWFFYIMCHICWVYKFQILNLKNLEYIVLVLFHEKVHLRLDKGPVGLIQKYYVRQGATFLTKLWKKEYR